METHSIMGRKHSGHFMPFSGFSIPNPLKWHYRFDWDEISGTRGCPNSVIETDMTN
jgi:hypothetical protein